MGASSALVPSLIGKHVPRIRGFTMGLYSTGLALGVAVAAWIALPSEQWLSGWRPALGLWGGITALTVVLWLALLPRLRGRARARPRGVRGDEPPAAVALADGLVGHLVHDREHDHRLQRTRVDRAVLRPARRARPAGRPVLRGVPGGPARRHAHPARGHRLHAGPAADARGVRGVQRAGDPLPPGGPADARPAGHVPVRPRRRRRLHARARAAGRHDRLAGRRGPAERDGDAGGVPRRRIRPGPARPAARPHRQLRGRLRHRPGPDGADAPQRPRPAAGTDHRRRAACRPVRQRSRPPDRPGHWNDGTPCGDELVAGGRGHRQRQRRS